MGEDAIAPRLISCCLEDCEHGPGPRISQPSTMIPCLAPTPRVYRPPFSALLKGPFRRDLDEILPSHPILILSFSTRLQSFPISLVALSS